jgi:hypothetical protein
MPKSIQINDMWEISLEEKDVKMLPPMELLSLP